MKRAILVILALAPAASADQISEKDMCKQGGQFHYWSNGWRQVNVPRGMVASATALSSFAGYAYENPTDIFPVVFTSPREGEVAVEYSRRRVGEAIDHALVVAQATREDKAMSSVGIRTR